MRNHRGFTLIELLVVVAIISLLVSILLPSLNRAKELARAVVCMSNMRGVGTAIHEYTNEYGGYFPQVSSSLSIGGQHWYFWSWKLHSLGFVTIDAGVGADEPPAEGLLRCPSRKYGTGWADRRMVVLYFTHYGPGVPGPMAPSAQDFWGHGYDRRMVASAMASQVRSPARVTLLGEIAPVPAPFQHSTYFFYLQSYGGYFSGVHKDRDNILFADNHVEMFDADLLEGVRIGHLKEYPINGDLQD